MNNLMWIHEFWTTQCPFFNDVQFIYYILDLASILIFFKIVITIVPYMIHVRTDVSKW